MPNPTPPHTPPALPAQNGLWPPSLDALVAAPEHHTLLFENSAVRVLDTHIAAGARTPLHTHAWPSVQRPGLESF